MVETEWTQVHLLQRQEATSTVETKEAKLNTMCQSTKTKPYTLLSDQTHFR